MLRRRSARAFGTLILLERPRPVEGGAGGRCVLSVVSVCAASAAFLMLCLFVASVWARPARYDDARIILLLFLTLTFGALAGVRALRRANRGAALYGGEGMAVAGIMLNALPAFFVVIWVCIAVLPLHLESSLLSVQESCSSVAQEVYRIAGK